VNLLNQGFLLVKLKSSPRKFYDCHQNIVLPYFVGELANAIRQKTNIKFGLYHCLYEWFNPLYINDMRKDFTTNEFAEVFIPDIIIHNTILIEYIYAKTTTTRNIYKRSTKV
jgi:hypothetical protein